MEELDEKTKLTYYINTLKREKGYLKGDMKIAITGMLVSPMLAAFDTLIYLNSKSIAVIPFISLSSLIFPLSAYVLYDSYKEYKKIKNLILQKEKNLESLVK